MWAWKNSDYLTGLGLTLDWKILEIFNTLGLILWYIELGLEKYLDFLTGGVRLILWYIGLGIT